MSSKIQKIGSREHPGVAMLYEFEPGVWKVYNTFFAESEERLIQFLTDQKYYPEKIMEAFGTTAFTRENMVEFLHIGPCEVTFTKVNGETRQMTCTLNEEVLKGEGVWKEPSEVTKKENQSVIAVYDTIAKGWRSFRVDSVTKFEYIG